MFDALYWPYPMTAHQNGEIRSSALQAHNKCCQSTTHNDANATMYGVIKIAPYRLR